jgi:FixJ family two-component response regulator
MDVMSPTDTDILYIVEDDAAVRDSLKLLLEAHGRRVREFGDASSFLSAYETGTGACLILDLHLPMVSGLALMEIMRRRGVNLPVIVMTANSDDYLMSRALQEGAVAFFDKPIGEHALMEAISKACLKQQYFP